MVNVCVYINIEKKYRKSKTEVFLFRRPLRTIKVWRTTGLIQRFVVLEIRIFQQKSNRLCQATNLPISKCNRRTRVSHSIQFQMSDTPPTSPSSKSTTPPAPASSSSTSSSISSTSTSSSSSVSSIAQAALDDCRTNLVSTNETFVAGLYFIVTFISPLLINSIQIFN